MNRASTAYSPIHARRHLARLAAAAGVFLVLSGLRAQEPKPTEYHVKATYLYNFAQFVQWPPNASAVQSDSFSICVLGQDPFHSILDAALRGETIDGRSVVARRISTPREAAICRILFITSSEDDRLKQILETLGQAGVLTVSDMPYFVQRGGMIQFTREGNRIRFAVNLTNAEVGGLTLSSELLKVAVTVRRSPQPGG
jgi:hypothetical protein